MTRDKDWRELCAAVASEQDLARMLALTDQLIAALDSRKPNRFYAATGADRATAHD